jgi:manganese transport protein
MNESTPRKFAILTFFMALGPAVIVASVVLGPGSILSSSKVGANFGFSMIWLLVLTSGLMMGTVALAARLGVVLEGTMCDELASRIGRPFAVLVGVTIFMVAAGFQFGNNLGVLAALRPWLSSASPDDGWLTRIFSVPNLILLLLNVAIVVFLFGLQKLYKPIERLMLLLVGLMILAFFGNLLFLLVMGTGEQVAEETASVAAGGSSSRDGSSGILMAQAGKPAFVDIPSCPEIPLFTEKSVFEPNSPHSEPLNSRKNRRDWIALLALVGTTFSVAGAFYQAYLVREKGWGLGDLRRGLIDSVAGISVLGAITLVIMCTAAISFYGRGVELKSPADVALQLKPLFGSAALILFSLGLFAGAFSSFLVNAMIGGAMLSDGIGWGGKMDSASTKMLTTLALLVGMLVAVFVPPAHLVWSLVFAQAATLIGLPIVAFSMLYLATRPDLTGKRATPTWMKVVAAAGLLVVVVCACGTLWTIIQKIAQMIDPSAT